MSSRAIIIVSLIFLFISFPSTRSALVNTTYMLDSPSFTYEPEGAWHKDGVAWTNVPNASIRMDFQGLAIYVKGLTKADRSVLFIKIDKSDPIQMIEYSTIESELWWGKKLKPGNHSFMAWKQASGDQDRKSSTAHPYVAFEAVVITTDDPSVKEVSDGAWLIAICSVISASILVIASYGCLSRWVTRRWSTDKAYSWDHNVIDASTIHLPPGRASSPCSGLGIITTYSPPAVENKKRFSVTRDLHEVKICQARMVNLPSYKAHQTINIPCAAPFGTHLPNLPKEALHAEKFTEHIVRPSAGHRQPL